MDNNLQKLNDVKSCFWDLYNLYIQKELNADEKEQLSNLGKKVLDAHFDVNVQDAP